MSWVTIAANAVTMVMALVILRQQRTIRAQLETIRGRQHDLEEAR